MYISPRAALVRNISVSLINGGITLVVLLIAPLGIVAVIINTLLITAATYTMINAVDWVTLYLRRDNQQAELLSKTKSQIRSRKNSELDR